MVKKIISVLSAVALSFSAFSVMVSAGYGDVALVDAVGKTSINSSTKAQYLAIESADMIGQYSISGEFYFAAPAGTVDGVVKSNGVGLAFYDEDNDEMVYPTVEVNLIKDANDDTPNDGFDTFKIVYFASKPLSTEDGILLEFGLKPVNKISADLEVKFIGGKVGTCAEDCTNAVDHLITDAAKAVTYVSKSGTCKVETKSAATPTPSATATPTPTPVVTPEPTATVEPTPEVTPEPTTGKGAITADTNDAAAWAWKTAAAAGSSVKVTVNANGETATKAFALKAAVDGTVKVGVIVQYNPTTFTSFEITDIVVE